MKNFRGENMEDSIRYSWTQFYELNVLAEDRILLELLVFLYIF
jgi:hypothetical protein